MGKYFKQKVDKTKRTINVWKNVENERCKAEQKEKALAEAKFISHYPNFVQDWIKMTGE